jgi:hypothetical protein
MEIGGVPTCTFIYLDQANFFENTALLTGCPGARWVDVPRIGHADEMVALFYDRIEKALCDPPTAEEQEVGLYSPPAPPRVAFEGTVDEAQDFFQQTTLIENCRNCPIATWTDGLPIIVPTEEKVREMLTGTSHDPNETIGQPYPSMGWGGAPPNPAGTPILYARSYTATVEKAAICAVMAGCKPEYMPAVIAIAVAGGNSTNCPGTSSMATTLWCVSGPYAKEIGMNAGQNAMDVGNHANMSLGRVGSIITVNFGGCITGLVRTDAGNMVHAVAYAEDLESLPPGWKSWAEESSHYRDTGEKDDNGNPVLESVNYTANESVIGKGFSWGFMTGLLSFPGYYRSLNQGSMGLARRLGVEGIPGYYNWMDAIVPALVEVIQSPGSAYWILHPNLAMLLYEYGFKSKQEVSQYLYDTYFVTIEDYYNTGLWDFSTNSGESNVRLPDGTTMKYKDLLAQDPDYKLHVFSSSTIVVSDGFADEHWYLNIFGGPPSAGPIDVWR